MPLQNRVSPEGRLHAVPDRGAWMGNRGILHQDGQILRSHAHPNWITCALSFKGVTRPLMAPNRYTELFFLDEATAYAAGHRPCAECRRPAYNAFAALWAKVHGTASAKEMDRQLHAERLHGRAKRVHVAMAEDLPDGVMVRGPEAPILLWRGCHDWSFAGYHRRPALSGEVEVLTPPALVALIRAGLAVQVHASAKG
jgi:hypothetical protein